MRHSEGLSIDLVFNGGDLSRWDVSSVTNMYGIFYCCFVFNGDLSRWNVSAVTDMGGIFYCCFVFNGDLSRWNVSSVTTMDRMFYGCSVFNGDLSRWNVSAATTMFGTFHGCFVFNGDLSLWSVSAVTNMGQMFYFCEAFNGDLPLWDVSALRICWACSLAANPLMETCHILMRDSCVPFRFQNVVIIFSSAAIARGWEVPGLVSEAQPKAVPGLARCLSVVPLKNIPS